MSSNIPPCLSLPLPASLPASLPTSRPPSLHPFLSSLPPLFYPCSSMLSLLLPFLYLTSLPLPEYALLPPQLIFCSHTSFFHLPHTPCFPLECSSLSWPSMSILVPRVQLSKEQPQHVICAWRACLDLPTSGQQQAFTCSSSSFSVNFHHKKITSSRE